MALQRVGSHLAVVSAILCLAAPAAQAGLIPVPPGGQIGAALAAAAPGDTVLVSCGTYQEQGLVIGSGVTLRGETGDPLCVVIASTGGEPILGCVDVAGVVRIEGITFTMSDAAVNAPVARGGGMLVIGAAPVVSRCVFTGLSADYGGAVHCGDGATPSFSLCEFTDNAARAVGGALNAVGSAAPVVAASLFARNRAEVSGGAVNAALGAHPRLVGCTVDDGGVGGGPLLQGWDAGALDIFHTIIVDGTWLGDPSAVPSLVCSDLYLGGADPWRGLLAGLGAQGGNFSADPLFCGGAAAISPYALDALSPCAADNSAGCGQVGAYPVGCAVSSVPDDLPDEAAPRATAILGSHPNPFNPMTIIRFNLRQAGPARIAVYDLAGRRVRVLADGVLPAGPHQVPWNGRTGDDRACAAGVYFVRLSAGPERDTHRVSLIK